MWISKRLKRISLDMSHLRDDLVADIKAEAVHIANPAQCGNIVKRHLDGLTMTLLLFVALFIGAAALGTFLYTHR